jgi:tetratricopeptide (TPR) repeat protein
MNNHNADRAKADEVQETLAGRGMTSTERAAWRAARRRSRKRLLVLAGVGVLVCGALYSWWSTENDPGKLGLEAYDAGRYEQAIEYFTRALRKNPQDATTFACRALAYLQEGNLERSLNDSEKAIRLAPDRGLGYVAKANALTALGQAPKALEVLNEGIRRDPKSARAYYTRAELVRKYGLQGADPVTDLQEAVGLNPQFTRAYAWLGILYDGRQEYDKAVVVCDRALELEKAQGSTDKEARALAYFGRGLALCELDQEKQGNEDIEMALRLNPGLGKALRPDGKKLRRP